MAMREMDTLFFESNRLGNVVNRLNGITIKKVILFADSNGKPKRVLLDKHEITDNFVVRNWQETKSVFRGGIELENVSTDALLEIQDKLKELNIDKNVLVKFMCLDIDGKDFEFYPITPNVKQRVSMAEAGVILDKQVLDLKTIDTKDITSVRSAIPDTHVRRCVPDDVSFSVFEDCVSADDDY